MSTIQRVPAVRRSGVFALGGKARAGAAAIGAGALVLLGAIAPAVAADGTWYVDVASGTDAADCGEQASSACATIGMALGQSAAGDTISIAPGMYTESLVLDSSVSLVGSADAVLVSDGSGPAISASGGGIDVSVTGLTISPDLAGDWYAVVADGGSTVELNQVSIEHQVGATALGPGVRAQNNSAVVLTDSSVQAASSTDEGGTEVRVGVSAGNGSDLTITRSVISPATVVGDGEPTGYVGIMLGVFAAEPGAPSTLTMSDSTVAVGALANVLIANGSATITNTSIPGGGIDNPLGGYGIGILNGSVEVTGGEITGHSTAGIGTIATLSAGSTAQVSVNGTTIADNGTEGESDTGGIVVRAGANDVAPAGSVDVTGAHLTDNTSGIVSHIPTTVTATDISSSGSGIVATDADLTVTDSQLVGGATTVDQRISGVESTSSGEEPVTLTVAGTEISNYPIGLASSARTDVSASTIAGNSTAGITVQRGPASTGDMTISDTEITGNGLQPTGPFGGGIVVSGGSLTATGVTIADNSNGILVAAGDATLTDSSVTGSGADALPQGAVAGVGIITLGGPTPVDTELTITGSEISGNRAGIALSQSAVVRNSTIADNTWFGITTQGQPESRTFVTLASSTLVGNGTEVAPDGEVDPFGLGVGTDSEVLVAGSILAGTSTGSVCYIDSSSGVLTDGGYNVVADGTCALTEDTSLADTDPLLGVLADNGGTTQTVLPALDSPAVELIPVGSTAGGTALELCLAGSTDQRGAGFTRPIGQACDAGAVETTYVPAQITTESLPDGTVDESYSVTLAATGGVGKPYEWAVTEGALPDGLVLDAATGEIGGVPTADGSLTFTVQVDGEATAEFTITIEPAQVVVPPVEITTEALPGGIVGQDYTALVEATGGDGEPYEWAVTEGALPDGLVLDAATGAIAGTPTADGSFTFTVQADGEAATEFTVTVLPELVILTDSLPEGTVGEPYSVTLEATGGDGGPYTWGIDSGDLPDGLELDPATGEITGTPTAVDSFAFTVVVGDPVYKDFTIEVVPAEVEETPPPEEPTPPVEDETPPADDAEEPAPPAEDETPPADESDDSDGSDGSADGDLPATGTPGVPGSLAAAGLMALAGGVILTLRKNRRAGLRG